jgi:hypothetical protein
VARYKHLSLDGIIEEMIACDSDFYSMPRILSRVWNNLRQRREPLISLVGNLSYRANLRLNRKAYADFKPSIMLDVNSTAENDCHSDEWHRVIPA